MARGKYLQAACFALGEGLRVTVHRIGVAHCQFWQPRCSSALRSHQEASIMQRRVCESMLRFRGVT